MEEQLLEIDSIADLRIALEDSVGSDAAVFVGGEVPPEQPEGAVGEAAGFAARNLVDIDDGTPSLNGRQCLCNGRYARKSN